MVLLFRRLRKIIVEKGENLVTTTKFSKGFFLMVVKSWNCTRLKDNNSYLAQMVQFIFDGTTAVALWLEHPPHEWKDVGSVPDCDRRVVVAFSCGLYQECPKYSPGSNLAPPRESQFFTLAYVGKVLEISLYLAVRPRPTKFFM